jgi:hypothetical protein
MAQHRSSLKFYHSKKLFTRYILLDFNDKIDRYCHYPGHKEGCSFENRIKDFIIYALIGSILHGFGLRR